MRHYLKKPTGKAKTFSIYIRTIKPDGSTKNEFIDNRDLSAINSKLLSGE